MSAAIDYTYRYSFPSSIETIAHKPRLNLSTCDARLEHPYFFDGKVREPRVLGDMLLVLSEVVRTHFFLPRPAILDPVLTSNESMLRLEGFSGCCGVYARVDLSVDAFEGEIKGRGTTNVDFNAPMRNALMRLRDEDDVRFAVGSDEVLLSQNEASVVEKKVKLPMRWVKGFSEVQAYQPQLEFQLEVSAADALQFIRGLPKAGMPKRPSFVVSSGRSMRLSQRETPQAIQINGTHRIRILEPLLVKASKLRIWYDRSAKTSAWEVIFETGRFFLMISPEVFRGFSGEGQNLGTLAGSHWQEILPQVRAQLAWQNQIHVDDIAHQLNLDVETVRAALVALGANGLAGYDVTNGHYFHREMPFDLETVEMMQPRLKGARLLLEKKGVRVINADDGTDITFAVIGTEVTHHVRLKDDGDRCTCPWFSKYQGKRGPCKHILAAQIFNDPQSDPD